MQSTSSHHQHQAIDQLYSHHHGWLQSWLRRRLGNAADAADLAQDTFVRLLCSAPGEPLNFTTPRAYLATIANRLSINLYRRRSLEHAYLAVLAQTPEDLSPSLEHQALVLEALDEIDQVLALLPARTRQAFLMAQLEGYTQEEIASQLGLSVRSVQRYLARAFEECIVLASQSGQYE
ncbi:sigma-70 family RNA polymerase sigma factor [Pseudomonas brenneri]|uniref:RNA polymerase sigma-70 factor, ECF subfamily n=1 Tax=Pseudomonas brenneri TaxID=129817 RepID=A0A5B2V1X0_9PSED|nr:sigma-70 family RNA polymerase sigma factor [Pseudomonas brenneri]KAA2233543.1 sigma-70 family RNA polymerase sigma factor [Pseudomonas brenneri]TWR82223.1 sigma-70 family RNA polymerase sigma factor [Pseudomonas brenneri]SDU92645.1 RNA polymerase sigma-70 factor, ECF subfamily [Pseudomonas brenneri]